MKHYLTVCCFFILNNVFSQSYFDRESDSCCFIQREKISATNWRIKYNDKCVGFSFIAEVEIYQSQYRKSGLYVENYFADSNAIRRKGYYLNNKETGLWQEFYKNGKLKLQGSCKPVSYQLNKKYPGKILKIDWDIPFDTTFLVDSKITLDSLKKTVWYGDSLLIPKSQFKSVMVFPSEYSLKVGEWNYYTESGELFRKEFYKNGTLIKLITY
jgi:antitoxin component YwqK of YwqJK toxin-antitoxin module